MSTDNGSDGGNGGNAGDNDSGNGKSHNRIGIAPVARGRPVTIAPAAIGHNPNAEPDTGDSTADSGSGSRRRGRPPGSRNRSARASETAIDLSGIQAALTSAHLVLSVVSKNPLWALDDTEAKQLAEAIRNATRHHDIAVAQKTIDYVNLAIVGGMVYGTRIMALQRQRVATKQRPTDDAAQQHMGAPNVTNFPGV